MNIGVETEKIEFKKTTGELREGITSLASMLNKNGYGILLELKITVMWLVSRWETEHSEKYPRR